MSIPASEVRAFVLDRHDLDTDVPDDFDLRANGLIDSFGVLELIGALEERFGLELDFDELDPEDLTVVGPLSRYVERKTGAEGST